MSVQTTRPCLSGLAPTLVPTTGTPYMPTAPAKGRKKNVPDDTTPVPIPSSYFSFGRNTRPQPSSQLQATLEFYYGLHPVPTQAQPGDNYPTPKTKEDVLGALFGYPHPSTIHPVRQEVSAALSLRSPDSLLLRYSTRDSLTTTPKGSHGDLISWVLGQVGVLTPPLAPLCLE